MSNKINLFWEPYLDPTYNIKKKLLIASLERKNNGSYIFKYEKEVIEALRLGCILPVAVPEFIIGKEFSFTSLPDFFARRIMPPISFDGGIRSEDKPSSCDELSRLIASEGRVHGDNYSIGEEEKKIQVRK